MKWTKIFIVLQLGQSLFLCSCCTPNCFFEYQSTTLTFFLDLYAVWKSRKSPVAKHCITVRLSMDFQASEKQQRDQRKPFSHKSDSEEPPLFSSTSHPAERFSKTDVEVGPPDTHTVETSVYGESSLTMPSPLSSSRSQQAVQIETPRATFRPRPLSGATPSLAPSTLSRISHYMPVLFGKVMKDEVRHVFP